MTDAPPSTALIAAGSPAAPDPITNISASRSQLRSLFTAVCSIVFHPLEEILISSESLTTGRAKIQHLQENLTHNSNHDTVLAATVRAMVSAFSRERSSASSE